MEIRREEMGNSEILLEILQNDEISKDDQNQLNFLIQNDPGLAKLYLSYKNISETVRRYSHLSTGEISEYILYKHGLSTDGTGIIDLAPKIEEHLKICAKCENEFNELNNEFVESEVFLDAALIKPVNTRKNRRSHLFRMFRKPYNLKIGISITITILLFCLSAVIITSITKPSYYDLAKLPGKSDFSIARGRVTDDFQRGIEALDDGNYSQAEIFFNNDIKLNRNENTIFYTYYVLGLTNLEFAQKNTSDLFPKFDKEKALISIKNLNTCIKKNNTGTFPEINMNANYYLAKAYLMLGKKEDALACLNKVINGKGSKMDGAAKILIKLK